MMQPGSSPRRLRGFTFAEMIVTLSLILLIAGMLFPVFVRSRESARRTQCQSNLKQLVTALHLYAQDNNGRFPSSETSPEWITALMPRVKNTAVFVCPSEPEEDRHRFRSGSALSVVSDLGPGAGAYPGSTTTAAGSSYRYVAGLANDDAPGSPVAADWGPWHFDGMNVAFLDGRIQWSARAESPLPARERPNP